MLSPWHYHYVRHDDRSARYQWQNRSQNKMSLDSVPSSQSDDQENQEDHREQVWVKHPIVVPKCCSIEYCLLLIHFSHHRQRRCCTKHGNLDSWSHEVLDDRATTFENHLFRIIQRPHNEVQPFRIEWQRNQSNDNGDNTLPDCGDIILLKLRWKNVWGMKTRWMPESQTDLFPDWDILDIDTNYFNCVTTDENVFSCSKFSWRATFSSDCP